MAIHTLPFYASAGSTTFPTQVNGLTSDVFPLNASSNYIARTDLYAILAVAMGSNLNRAEIFSPTLQQLGNLQIKPVIFSGGTGNPQNIAYFLQTPVCLYK